MYHNEPGKSRHWAASLNQLSPGARYCAMLPIRLPGGPLHIRRRAMPITIPTPIPVPRVLVLEDEELILVDIESTLAEAHYEVRSAATAKQALALLDGQAFDVAVLDVGLRSGKSLAVADALLKRAIPFIFSTGSSDPIPVEFAAVPVIMKPFAGMELLSLVGSVLAPR